MSLFSDILSSIGGDPVPKPPQPPVNRAASATGLHGTPNTTHGTKRKAEDGQEKQQAVTSGKPVDFTNGVPKLAYTGTMAKARSSSTSVIQRRRSSDGKPTSRPSTPAAPVPAPAFTKAPAKGSYAEIIARAKAAQEERGQNQAHVGMIKHQKEQREKVSYLAQRKAVAEDTKAKAEKLDKQKIRPVLNGRIEKRARSHSPLKRPGSSKTDKPRAPKPTYNGTMRTAPGKPREKPRPARRQDGYLGTDEEDNSDLSEEMEEENYGSDASSDNMEAGAFDIDEEEAAAARAARIDDAKEAALEKRLKAEKEERRKKLEALSRKAPKQKY